MIVCLSKGEEPIPFYGALWYRTNKRVFPRNCSSATKLTKERMLILFQRTQNALIMQALASLPTNSRVKVGKKRLKIQLRLGNGAFGVVYKVQDVSSSRVYALKDVLCLNKAAIRNTLREVETMEQISHENVIAMIGADQHKDAQGLHMLILTEYCSGGNLNERLTQPSRDELNLKWIRQTAAALSFLHSRSVVHRDLKADNVLLTDREDAKLADFGLAREYIALKRTVAQRDDGYWMTSYTQYYMNSGIGPVHWIAPEFFSYHYTEKADVFSIGTLFYAILERDFIMVNRKAYYGAFTRIPGAGKVGIGYAMAKYDPNTRIQFSPRAQGSNVLQRITLDAMQYDKDDRPSAAEIHDKVTQQNVSVQRVPSASSGWCC